MNAPPRRIFAASQASHEHQVDRARAFSWKLSDVVHVSLMWCDDLLTLGVMGSRGITFHLIPRETMRQK